MDEPGEDARKIDDLAFRLFLRLRTGIRNVSISEPAPIRTHDLAFFRLFWAGTSEVEKLATRIVDNPHEAAATLDVERIVDANFLTGRIDGRQTALRHLITGDASIFTVLDPVRSYNTGPNHVLTWVLEEARRLCRTMLTQTERGSSYDIRFGRVHHALVQASRMKAVKAAIGQINLKLRPSRSSITQALRSRIKIYQLAARAYLLLEAVERGDSKDIISVLHQTLLGPLETWRRFELCTALAIGESLAEITGAPAELSHAFEQGRPLISVGPFRIFWQKQTAAYVEPSPEPSEIKVAEILEALGLQSGGNRPDIVIIDTRALRAVSIIEVKYFLGDIEDADGALRQAVSQVVDYARGFREPDSLDDIIRHSIIVPVRSTRSGESQATPVSPWVMDLGAISSHWLDNWSSSLLSSYPI